MEREPNEKSKVNLALDHSEHQWQKRDSLVFRVVRDCNVFTLNSLCEVVDIRLNEAALKELTDDKNIGDNTDVLTIDWDTWESPRCSSLCQIHFQHDSKKLLRTVVLQLMRGGCHQLQSLVETIFREYTTRITHVRYNPFEIEFLHHNLKDFKRMESNVENLEDTFRYLFSKCANVVIKLRVQLHLCINLQEGLDEEINLYNSDGFLHDSESNLDGRQNLVSSKEEVQSGADDEREQKFRKIEGSLKAQRHAIESKFDEQRTQNEEMNKKLQSLLESIQLLPRLGNLQTSITQDMSPSHDQSKDKHSATEDKKQDTLKVLSVRFDDCLTGTFMGNQHLAEESQNDDKKVRKSLLGAKSRSQSRKEDLLSNQNQVAYHRQLPQEVVDEQLKKIVINRETKLSLSYFPYLRPEDCGSGTGTTTDIPRTHLQRLDLPQTKGNYEDDDKLQSERTDSERECQNKAPPPRPMVSRGIARSFLSAHGVSDESPQIRRLMRTVEEAMIDDVPMPLKARSLDTILCLDTSSSMGVEGLKEMKEIALNFVDGIEDIASQYEREENIAVVTFGGHSRIAHHLSNDYSSIRNTIEDAKLGGRSPLFEALLVCLCTINGRGGVLNIFGVHNVPPRLIIITDGKASDETESSTDVENCPMDVKMGIVSLIRDFGSKESNTFPKPLVWIPAGKADEILLSSLANISHGKFLKGHQVKQLCSYQRIQITVAEMFVCLQNENPADMVNFEDHCRTLLGAMATNMDREERNEVVETLKAKLDGKPGSGNPSSDPENFDNVHEAAGLPPLGTRVTRGKDWVWENQDTEGTGTVVNHEEQSGSDKGLLWVLWDNGTHKQYRYGQNNAYDVKEAPDQPRNTSGDIEVGCEVTRGPDWKQEYMEQDGGDGGVGVVINKNNSGMVQVRWRRNCYIGVYRYDRRGAKDLSIRDPIECLLDHTSKDAYRLDWQSRSRLKGEGRSQEKGSWIWRWQSGDNKWHIYPDDIMKKLEEAFTVRSERSCLIRKNGKSYRVSFKDMHEKNLEDQTRRQVARDLETK